jgi:hypothetical protein
MAIFMITKTLLTVAGLLFLVSIFLPFISFSGFSMIPEVGSVIDRYWSFKMTVEWVYKLSPHQSETVQYWFGDYWKLAGVDTGFQSSLLIAMLATQVLTVLFAAFAAFKMRLPWVLLPVAFSAGTVLCMWYVSQPVNITAYQPGFWLALASAVLFLATFIVSLIEFKNEK